jgi:hypothetical protein
MPGEFTPVEIRLMQSLSVPVLNALYTEKDAGGRAMTEPGIRLLQNNQIKLDSKPSVRGAVHDNDGSTCLAWYVAGNRSTERAIREGREWSEVMQMPRHLYPGKLIDILRGSNGVYIKIRTMSRRDESHDNSPAFRSFNPSVGRMIALVINPSEALIAEEIARSRSEGRTEEAEQLQTARDEVAVRGS